MTKWDLWPCDRSPRWRQSHAYDRSRGEITAWRMASLGSHFVIRPRRACRFTPQRKGLTGKAFTTPLTSSNPNIISISEIHSPVEFPFDNRRVFALEMALTSRAGPLLYIFFILKRCRRQWERNEGEQNRPFAHSVMFAWLHCEKYCDTIQRDIHSWDNQPEPQYEQIGPANRKRPVFFFFAGVGLSIAGDWAHSSRYMAGACPCRTGRTPIKRLASS